jgi:hypothetical protein
MKPTHLDSSTPSAFIRRRWSSSSQQRTAWKTYMRDKNDAESWDDSDFAKSDRAKIWVDEFQI